MREALRFLGRGQLLPSAVIIFSAVSLSTIEFIKNAFPYQDAIEPSRQTVVYVILLVMVVPSLMLLAADRLIAWRLQNPLPPRAFRTVVFVVAFLLIYRQLQLYWDPAGDFNRALREMGAALPVLFHLAVVAAAVALPVLLYRGVNLFFAYMFPIAIVVSAIIPSQVHTADGLPANYAREAGAAQSSSGPPAFILVFDELGYDVLLDESGRINAEDFPNVAALAAQGLSFSNATTNNFWSIPTLVDMVGTIETLDREFDVRLYTNYVPLERRFLDRCGREITCRGVSYLTDREPLRLAGQISLRAAYRATPDIVEDVTSRPARWVLDRLGWAYPPLDSSGWHTLTKRHFDLFIDDINPDAASRRVYFFHILLPHHPNVFDENGNAISPSHPRGKSRYKMQSMFVDKLVGRFIERLREAGIYDESVILLTGDHGPRPFHPTPERPPQPAVARVPLIIHGPDLPGHGLVSDIDYQHMDFEPTLMDLLGLPRPAGTKGLSVFREDRPERDKVFSVLDDVYIYDKEKDFWAFAGKQ